MEHRNNNQLRILVVDDEPDMLKICGLILAGQNYVVSTAGNAEECFKQIKENKPDLILLDVILPDISGYDICKTIKSDPGLDSIFIIFLSGTNIMSDYISHGFEIGADDYLIKPFKKRELLARVSSAARIIFSEKELKLAQEKLKMFSVHLIEQHEEEKIMLATQLDNELNQSLVALKIKTGLIRNKLTDNDELLSTIDEIQRITNEAVRSSVKLMNILRNELLYLVGIEEAIRSYVDDINKKHDLNCSFISRFPIHTTDRNLSTSLFRIFQISMGVLSENSCNANPEIELLYQNETIVLKLGKKNFSEELPSSAMVENSAIGNLKEMVKLLNGTVNIGNYAEKGMTIWVELPCSTH